MNAKTPTLLALMVAGAVSLAACQNDADSGVEDTAATTEAAPADATAATGASADSMAADSMSADSMTADTGAMASTDAQDAQAATTGAMQDGATGSDAVGLAAAGEANFAAMDLNGDGGVTRDEIPVNDPLAASFDKADADANGSLSPTEVDQFRASSSVQTPAQ